jgi:hypothetical protein
MRTKLVATTITAAFAAVMAACTHSPQVPQVTVSFSRDIIPIFQASCTIGSDCHSVANNANSNIDLSDNAAYSTIVSKGLVMVNTPVASLLYVEVSSGVMPKAPYLPLSQAQLSTILTWIKQGALNN